MLCSPSALTGQIEVMELLPPHFSIIYDIALMEQVDLDQAIEQGIIKPGMTRESLRGIVTLSEIVPIWTTDRQAKPLKSHASKSAVVGKFQSIRLNVTTPLQRYCPLGQ